MPTCATCGEHVTARFQRVFAGNDGEVYGCPGCMEMTAIVNGEAATLTDG
ncbi:DUF7563 family protein [Halalkalicoccus salilacus]